jgi:hypothetical protein
MKLLSVEVIMLKVLEFVFQDFSHWLGTLILLSVLVSPLLALGAGKTSK